MKHLTTSILSAVFAVVLCGGNAQAQLSIPSDGSDGVFHPTENIEVDLGQATTAAWDAAGSGHGVYDAEKWAVVFKYSSVDIPAGVKVTFKNHPSYAPVVWLVQGDVNIAGELNLDGKNGTEDSVRRLTSAEPGPGGFRGGATGPAGYGGGLGPGGGEASGGAFGPSGQGLYSSSYGNPQIIPLIGGSGNGGYTWEGTSGSAGGGAIAIYSSNTITISGKISAQGGQRNLGGSGGAIKLIANSILGDGSLICQSWTPGRIRIESNYLAASIQTAPQTISVPPANPPIIWPAENAPTARVVSVDAINAPTDPHAPLVAAADVAIQNSNPVNIVIETKNFPIEGVVQLFITQKFGGRTTLNATRLSGDITSSIWNVQTTLPQGFVTLQARATQP